MAYDLVSEINAKLDELATLKREWNARWIAHAICQEHDDGLSGDEDHDNFWRFCGYEKTRDEVRRAINKRAGDKQEQADPQLVLPGYEHLQTYYLVRRDGADVGMHVSRMTDDELEAKAGLYRTMAASCYAHADELERYREYRAEKANAAHSST